MWDTLRETVLLACATHWTTSLMYFAPVVGFGAWLGLTSFRDKRRERAERISPVSS